MSERLVLDRVAGREVSVATVARMTNCRLKKTRTRLEQLLMAVEEEIDSRMGKGGGGLK